MRQPVGTTETSWPADIEHGADASKSGVPTDSRAIIFLLLISCASEQILTAKEKIDVDA